MVNASEYRRFPFELVYLLSFVEYNCTCKVNYIYIMNNRCPKGISNMFFKYIHNIQNFLHISSKTERRNSKVQLTNSKKLSSPKILNSDPKCVSWNWSRGVPEFWQHWTYHREATHCNIDAQSSWTALLGSLQKNYSTFCNLCSSKEHTVRCKIFVL